MNTTTICFATSLMTIAGLACAGYVAWDVLDEDEDKGEEDGEAAPQTRGQDAEDGVIEGLLTRLIEPYRDHLRQQQVETLTAKDEAERVTVLDYSALPESKGSLSLILNERGGVIDDTVITRFNDHAYMVINGACKHTDLEHMRQVH